MRVSNLVIGALVAGSAAAIAAPAFGPPARPGPPVRKPGNVTWSAESLSTFADAIMADKAGDLEKAEQFYRRSSDEDKPEFIYNHADVQRRMERTKDAIETYKKYLEAAPDASDRAEVEKLIERLSQTPAIITVDGEDPDAVVYVDGVLAGPSPQTLQVTPGRHSVDRIGRASFEHHNFEGKPLDVRHLSGYGNKEETGNVVLSAAGSVQYSGGWRDGDREWHLPGRFTLAPGHYETTLFRDSYACSPLSFDVPRGAGVTYVYIDAPDREREDRGCIPITVKVKKVTTP